LNASLGHLTGEFSSKGGISLRASVEDELRLIAKYGR
jgi:hypothetical protein